MLLFPEPSQVKPVVPRVSGVPVFTPSCRVPFDASVPKHHALPMYLVELPAIGDHVEASANGNHVPLKIPLAGPVSCVT